MNMSGVFQSVINSYLKTDKKLRLKKQQIQMTQKDNNNSFKRLDQF